MNQSIVLKSINDKQLIEKIRTLYFNAGTLSEMRDLIEFQNEAERRKLKFKIRGGQKK